MKRPLFIFLLFLILGLLTGKYVNLILGIFILLVFNIILVFFIYRLYNCKIAYIFIFAFIMGIFIINNSNTAKNKMLDCYIKAGEIFILEGIVEDVDYTSSGREKIIFKVNRSYLKRKHFDEKYYIQAILPLEEYVELGQNLKLEGKLLCLNSKRNPGGFDEFLYLKTKNIDYKIFPEKVEKGQIKNNLTTLLYMVKTKLFSIYDYILPNKESSIVKSMILGYKKDLENDIIDLYRISGIYHLLIISGLHIAVLSIFLNFILEKIFTIKLSAMLTIIIIVLYCNMVGNGISTVRAVIMSCIVLVGKLLYRESDFLTSISFAAICILLYNPFYLWDIGFQLSFTIVFSIAIGVNYIDRLYGFLFKKVKFLNLLLNKKKLRNSIAVTTAISLCISPILSYYFFYVTPYSIIVNLFVVPTAGIIIVFGFLISIIGIINIHIAEFLSGVVVILLRMNEFICRIFVSLPFSNILIGQINFLFMIGYYLVLGMLFFMLSDFNYSFIKKRNYFFVGLGLYISMIIFYKFFNNDMEVTFLDVGAGESTIINFKNETYVIDGGGWINKKIGENSGQKVVKRFLDYKGINKIDNIYVTNINADHVIGIIELISLKNVKKVTLPFNVDTENKLYLKLKDEINKYNIELEFVDSDHKNISKNGVLTEIIYPFKDNNSVNKKDTNMVLRLKYKDVSFLFASDIKSLEKKLILDKGVDISASILKVSLYEFLKDCSFDFLKSVEPIIAVINSKKSNYYNFIDEELLYKFKYNNVNLYDIAEDGAIVIKTDGKKISLYKIGGGDKYEELRE